MAKMVYSGKEVWGIWMMLESIYLPKEGKLFTDFGEDFVINMIKG